MVRVKTKARKGDDAFQTRKQKVGRRKLLPVTATRAEVHARTLKVTTPAAITRTAFDMVGDTGGKKDSGRGKQQEDSALLAEKVHHDFRECISNTQHYKNGVRSGAFASLARAITLNCEVTGRCTQNTNCVSGYSCGTDDATLSPLEVLSAFASALDAMSDTEDDVRRAAFSTLRVILSLPSFSSGHVCGNSEMVPDRRSFMTDGRMSCEADKARAVLQVVDVTLTHAMSSVRRSGVELLHLILQASPCGVRTVLGKSDAWVKLASRASSILLQGGSCGSNTASSGTTNLFCVLPELLETMLMQSDGQSLSDYFRCDQQQQQEEEISEKGWVKALTMDGEVDVAPVRILEFFDECAPKWSMEWKEMMETRSAIFRDLGRVQRAIAIARAFACVTTYLRGHGMLKKAHKQLICHLFTAKMPFTMRELTASLDGDGGRARVALANAVADVCLPVADFADDALRLVRDFLSAVFVGANGTSTPSPAPLFTSFKFGSSSGKMVAQLLGPLRTLRTALLCFPETLLSRLLFVVPPLLRAVTRTVGDADCSAWASVSLLTADVFALLLRSRAAAASLPNLRCLRAVVLAVPRLLFSLRGKMDSVMVDRVVFAFLHPLWRAVSSGHPFLRRSFSSLSLPNNKKAKCETVSNDVDDVAAQLCVLLPSLFEIRLGCDEKCGAGEAVKGVLSRCTSCTEELAAHLFFYLRTELPRGAAMSITYPLLVNTLPGFC